MRSEASLETEPAAQCDSCEEFADCKNDLKGASICRKYRTRILQLYDGKLVRFHCVGNDKWSDWVDPAKLDDYVGVSKEVAKQLHVRVKDVWKLLVQGSLPAKTLEVPLPSVDLSAKLSSLAKQRVRYSVAQALMANYHFLSVKEEEEILVYKQGVYVAEADEIVGNTIRQVLGDQATTYDRNELRGSIWDVTLTSGKIFSHNPEHKVCLENGILNLDSLEFEEHSARQYFRSKIPVIWNPEADCPRIDEFLHQVVNDSDVETLYELTGYCLYPAYPIHKAFMYVGDGHNGKTTFLNVQKAFLGAENCCGLSLQQLGQSRFATSALVGKFANVCADIPSTALQNTGTFKMLVGADLIGGEYKFGRHFTFENYAKLIFSANKIPETSDDTDAFFRRWMIIVFPNRFTSFSEPKANPSLLHELTTTNELSGLLSRAVKALQSLLDRGHFHGDKPTSEWREDYVRKSDPIAAFVMDCLLEEPDADLVISKADLYRGYVKYCKENSLPPVDNVVFSRKVKAHFEKAQESTATIEGKRARVWRNLRWKSQEERRKNEELDDYL